MKEIGCIPDPQGQVLQKGSWANIASGSFGNSLTPRNNGIDGTRLLSPISTQSQPEQPTGRRLNPTLDIPTSHQADLIVILLTNQDYNHLNVQYPFDRLTSIFDQVLLCQENYVLAIWRHGLRTIIIAPQHQLKIPYCWIIENIGEIEVLVICGIYRGLTARVNYLADADNNNIPRPISSFAYL
jgi:hypothetical protein